jgi:hypothetical protein
MALSSSGATSKNLLEATLALSLLHLKQLETAIKHKVNAIKTLLEIFRVGTSSRIVQAVSCIILCVYSVSPPTSLSREWKGADQMKIFNASDTKWHLRLHGANTIAQAMYSHDRGLSCLGFLQPWIDYHESFAGYSHSPWDQDIPLLGSTRNVRFVIRVFFRRITNPFVPDNQSSGMLSSGS